MNIDEPKTNMNTLMPPVRPNENGVFPILPHPFNGQVCLGNGTQWRLDFLMDGATRIAVSIYKRGICIVSYPIEAEDIMWRIRGMGPDSLLLGDAQNISDFLNDQFGREPVKRQGHYFRNCTTAENANENY